MLRTRHVRMAVRATLTAAIADAACSALYAQEQPTPTPEPAALEEVIVTGTRLPTTPNETSISPITSVSATDILRTGLTRIEDVLNSLPMVSPDMNSTVDNGADGTAAVDLRGLGAQRTLVLVDGVRLGPGSADGRNWSDVNQIPIALIERVDILTGGASAVYGADAVAGVVNFIINTHFEGVKVDAGYHFNEHHNSDQDGVAPLVTAAGDALPPSHVDTGFGKNAALTLGTNFANNAGNVSAYVAYDNQAATLESKFDYSACALNSPAGGAVTSLACAGSFASRGGDFFAFSNSGAVLISNTVDPKTGLFRPFVTPGDLYNYEPVNFFQVPNERWTAGTFVNYVLNSHAELYASVMYMRNSMAAQIAPSAAFGVTAFIPCADPLLTTQEVATLCTPANIAANGGNYEVYKGENYPGLNMYIERRNVEGGNRIYDHLNNAPRAVVGVKGSFADGWTYNAYAQRASVRIDDNTINDFGIPQIEEALNVLPGPNGPICGGPTGVSGNPLIAPGTVFIPTPKCVPWNIWVPNGVTPASLASMTIPEYIFGSVTEQIVSGSSNGDLGKYGVKVPAAEQGLQVNIGAEWRKEQSSYVPNYELQQGYDVSENGVPVPPIAGEFAVREMFTEMRLPLATRQPLAEDLFVEGGYRYSRYSNGFDTNTYKFGLQWTPVRDVHLRGSYQRAVRAPNISELYYPQSFGSDGTIDPCAGTPTASLAACELTGVKPSQYGHIQPSPFNSYNGVQGGNPKLHAEIGDTYTVGLVLQPRVVTNLTLSFDYFDIKLRDEIGSIGANVIMLDCLASVGNPAQAGRFCPLIHRDAEGTLWLTPEGYVSDLYTNVGELATRGIDVNGSYRVPLATAGSLSFALVGTYLQSYEVTPVAGFGSYDCIGYFGDVCGNVTPKWRHVLNTTWATPRQGVEVSLRWRYIGPDESNQTSTNPFLSGTPYLPLAHIPAYNYFDLNAAFRLDRNITLQMGVNNLADKAPPLVVGTDCQALGCNGNTFPGNYDAMGRYLFVHVSARW
jgi:iron complex outermembrane recepter protein